MDTSRKELIQISRLLRQLGFTLEAQQLHISGERFLLAPNKLVLAGRRRDDKFRVIIKISRLAKGKKEIIREKETRDALSVFSNGSILFPREIYFGDSGPYLMLMTEFINQDKIFESHPLEKQFSLILKTFKARENLNGSFLEKRRRGLKSFPIMRGENYLQNFKRFYFVTQKYFHHPEVKKVFREALRGLKMNKAIVNKYCDHLVHADFVPHNFRVKNNSLYILDCSAFRFGNKYEEWARLANYMVIHNPALEQLLKEYILKKKGETDYLAFRLMRIYKLGFLLEFYSQALSKTDGNLHSLMKHRLELWQDVLKCILQDKALDKKRLKAFLKNLHRLRSKEEKKRQRDYSLI